MKSQLTTILSVEEIRFGPVGLFFLDFCLHHHPHDSSKGQLPCKVVASNFVAHHHFIEPLIICYSIKTLLCMMRFVKGPPIQ